MGQKKKPDPDEKLRKQYGGSGAVGDLTSPGARNVHDTFKDIMTGKERTVGEWQRDISPMRAAAASWRKKTMDDIAERQRGRSGRTVRGRR